MPPKANTGRLSRTSICVPGRVDGLACGATRERNRPQLSHRLYERKRTPTIGHHRVFPNSIMLAKPFAPAQLVTAVSSLLNAGPPTSPTG